MNKNEERDIIITNSDESDINFISNSDEDLSGSNSYIIKSDEEF